MSNSNQVQLIGNAGGKPEIRTFETGSRIGTFSIAVNDYFTDSKGQPQQRTNWFRVVLYGKILDAVENSFDKGSRIMVIGELRSREYLNSQQQKIQTVEVSCSTLHVFMKKEQ